MGSFRNLYIIVYYNYAVMARNFESTPGATYAEPITSASPLMDSEISLHDKVMLDDPKCEEKLDHLLSTWNRVHSK